MKKMLLTALVSAVALGTVGVGFSMAQGATLTDTEVITADTETTLEGTIADNNGCLMGKGRGAGQGFEKMLDQKAEILNLTEEELKAKLDEGKTFVEIAEEQGVTYTEIQNSMNSQFEENLQARIDSGFLTQEQADQLREQHNENDGMMMGMAMGEGMGGRHRGGMNF